MLAKRHLKNQLSTQSGMAVLEIIPIAIVVILLLSFAFGFFGVIHTGILNSMAARNYAFENFNHRTDLRYRRSTIAAQSDSETTADYFYPLRYRVHAITSDRRPTSSDAAMATGRDISFGWNVGTPEHVAEGDRSYHNTEIFTTIKDDGTRYTTKDGVNPVWIQTTYGICLSSKCQPD